MSALYKFAPSMAPVIMIYIICHLGHDITQRYSQIGIEMYAISWYKLPTHEQNNWPIMIVLTQKRIGLRSFGTLNLNRETYMEVTNLFIQ